MFGHTFSFVTNQADILFNSAFEKIIVKALRAGLNTWSGHSWPPGLSLPHLWSSLSNDKFIGLIQTPG